MSYNSCDNNYVCDDVAQHDSCADYGDNIGFAVCKTLLIAERLAPETPEALHKYFMNYCTYLTVYLGNKLPPFYIGSSNVERIRNGYKGSVSSKRFRSIWNSELKANPHLFKTHILSYHNSQKKSIAKELFFHEKLNVVKSDMYINCSKARKNGFFGMDVSGSNNPMFGVDRSQNHPKGMLGKKHSAETRARWSKNRKGKRLGVDNPMFGTKWTPEQRAKVLAKRTGVKRGPYKKKSVDNPRE